MDAQMLRHPDLRDALRMPGMLETILSRRGDNPPGQHGKGKGKG